MATIEREWTLMFYFASDNPLTPSIIPQLKAIKQAGFHQQVNVIAQLDPQIEGTPTHIFDVNLVNKLKAASPRFCQAAKKAGRSHLEKVQVGFSGFGAADPFVSNLIEDKLWRNEQDRDGRPIRGRLIASLNEKHIPYSPQKPPRSTKLMKLNGDGIFVPVKAGANGVAAARGLKSSGRNGSQEKMKEVELSPKESLRAFLNFCAKAYPARHYILFILGHGVVVGNDIFLFDQHADTQSSLSLVGLGEVLREFKKRVTPKGQKPEEPGAFELVSFHSCSVSSLEVAYELQGTANYMLASQGPAFVGSWPYRQILIRIFKDTDELKRLDDAEKHDKVKKNIADAFADITSYCFHNSKDFLLAGHSFDVNLCDLRRVGHLTDSLRKLKDALKDALEDVLEDGAEHDPEKDPVIRNLILLAHWEAQSDWKENYTDLHDFCFCLNRQCAKLMKALGEEALGKKRVKKLEVISRLCENVICLLTEASRRKSANGVCERSERMILRSLFAGPDHQFAHGMSVYFPWSRPTADQLILSDYEKYKFNKETGWLEFLNSYFDNTLRETRRVEVNRAVEAAEAAAAEAEARLLEGEEVETEPLSKNVRVGSTRAAAKKAKASPPLLSNEELDDDLASLVFNNGGRAGGETLEDPLPEKSNPRDVTGDGCTCGDIKNYPRDTRDLRIRWRRAPTPDKQHRVVILTPDNAVNDNGDSAS